MIADLTSRAFWREAVDAAGTIFHLAGQTSVYAAQEDPSRDHAANVAPMLLAMEACRISGRRPAFVFAGTVTQCGIPKTLPVNEDAPDDPVTIYDLHKLMAEQYLKLYASLGFVRGASLRLPNVYGPGPASRSADRGVLNAMIRKALAGETLTVYGQGDQVRDYLYVEDAARAFVAAADHIDSLEGNYFVLGTGEGRTIREAVDLVAARVSRRTGRHVKVVQVDPPASLSPIEDRNFVADTHRFASATGWRAEVGLSDGIDRAIEEVLREESVKA
jgi:nucleoside-diphosphate-sugar epimerase